MSGELEHARLMSRYHSTRWMRMARLGRGGAHGAPVGMMEFPLWRSEVIHHSDQRNYWSAEAGRIMHADANCIRDKENA